jgi:phage regulator Rha-like protein
LAADLKKWRPLKPKTRDQLQSIENQMLADQMLHPSLQNPSLQHQLHQQHQTLQNREEVYYIQRAKKLWVVKGHRNTEFPPSHNQKK